MVTYNHCSELQSINFSGWDTSNVTNMRNMFENLCYIPSLDLREFETSNVTDMSYMFHGMDHVTSLDVSSFDTSNVTNMRGMFRLASTNYLNSTSDLQVLDLSNFDLSKVTDISYMFYKATSLTNLKTPKNILPSVELSNVTTSKFTGSDGKTYAAGTFPTGNTASITLTR